MIGQTMSASKVNLFLKGIEELDFNCENLRGLDFISPEIKKVLELPDGRIQAFDIDALFTNAAKLLKNEDVGLIQGSKLTKGFSNILGHLMVNCSSLGEAVEKFNKYELIMDATSRLNVLKTDGTVIFNIETLASELKSNRYLLDFRMSGLLSYMKILVGTQEPIPLEAVYLEYPEPLNINEHQKIYKCPIHFNSMSSRLVFHRQVLSSNIIDANHALLEPFERIALEQLGSLLENTSYAQKVVSILLQEISGEVPQIDKVARELQVSVRSLQGHLKLEGTTYLQLSCAVRKGMAMSYLKNKQTPIAEIAFVLGFSEVSAFSRAFKKWTNTTPNEYRLSLDACNL